MSFQPEERYWTDYLRIALPVMGLILMVGLLWWWAADLIGSPADEPPATEVALGAVEPINATPPPPTSTPTPEPVVPTPGPPPTATAAPAVEPEQTAEPPPPTAAPTAAPAAAGDPANPCADAPPSYEPGAAVVTTDDVNLREGPSVDTPAITTLNGGSQLTITGSFSEQGQCDWWPVSNPATDQAGFVREDFLQPAP